MRISCDQIEKQIIDYLDGTLDPKDHKNFEEHIDACAACSQNLQQQRQWLEETVPLLAADPGRMPALDLSDKIKAAVRTAAQETENQETDVPPPLSILNRRPLWQRLAATAAAVVILAVSVQVFISLYNTTFGRSGDQAEHGQEMTIAGVDTDTGFQALDNGDNFAEDGENGITAETAPADRTADETAELTAAENWQIYKGSLAELPVGSSLFGRPDEDGSEKTVETSAGADPDSDDDPVAPDDPGTESTEQQPVADLLCEASAVRVLTREGPPAETMIMAFWPQEEVDEYWKLLSDMSLSWPYTVHLAKVSAAEEQLRLRRELGAELAEQIFDEIDFEQWVMIKIRLGE